MYKKTILDSGLTIVTEAHKHQKSVCVGVFVNTGTRDEKRAQMGVTHFVEHMVFKGTKKRSASEISRAIEEVGGDLNAYTTREYTCFHATSLKENLGLDIEVIGDLLTSPRFSEKDFLLEKKVILQEVAMTEDNPEEYIYDLFFEKTYSDNSLGWPILGTEASLKSLRRSHLMSYFKEKFTPKNMILAAAGSIDHDDVVEKVEKYFKFRKSSKKSLRAKIHKVPRWNTFSEIIEKPGEQTHVLVGFNGVSYKDKKRFDAFVLNAWLGGGMSSKLYQSIRERKGLAYTVYSNLTTFTDCGTLTVYAGTDGKSVGNVLDAIYHDVDDLKLKKLSEKSLNVFKQQVRGNILLGSEDMENRMTSLGVNEMTFNKYFPVEEIVSGIESVTASGVRDLARSLLDTEKMTVFVMGDVNSAKVKKLIDRK
jgi:predicted Zn-dependent peptidase